jgi:hypothetical protein
MEEDKQNFSTSVVRHTPALSKLEDCLNALKDSMIHNYMCLDFCKEIQLLIAGHQYQDNQVPEVMHFVNEVNRVLEVSGMNSVQYNSDVLETVRDDCFEFLNSM